MEKACNYGKSYGKSLQVWKKLFGKGDKCFQAWKQLFGYRQAYLRRGTCRLALEPARSGRGPCDGLEVVQVGRCRGHGREGAHNEGAHNLPHGGADTLAPGEVSRLADAPLQDEPEDEGEGDGAVVEEVPHVVRIESPCRVLLPAVQCGRASSPGPLGPASVLVLMLAVPLNVGTLLHWLVVLPLGVEGLDAESEAIAAAAQVDEHAVVDRVLREVEEHLAGVLSKAFGIESFKFYLLFGSKILSTVFTVLFGT